MVLADDAGRGADSPGKDPVLEEFRKAWEASDTSAGKEASTSARVIKTVQLLAEDIARRWAQGEEVRPEEYLSMVENDRDILDQAYRHAERLLKAHAAEQEDPSIGGIATAIRTLSNRYRNLREAARGGQGVVLKGHDTKLKRNVAVKLSWFGGPLSGSDYERFEREAKCMARLEHPGIVVVHDFGYVGGYPYIVTEWVEGQTLREWREKTQPSFEEIARLVALVARALDYCHNCGIIHRDVKASNILVTKEGVPKLTDFGLAHLQGDATVTRAGDVLGTPAYMSPELARGEAYLVDRRTDIYSLGVVLFELLTGELPFRGRRRDVLRQIVNNDPPWPRTLNSSVPRDLEAICLKAMAREPRARYNTAGELADDLERFINGEPVKARAHTLVARLMAWCTHPQRVRDCGACSVFLSTVLLVWALWGIAWHLALGPGGIDWRAIGELAVLAGGIYAPGIYFGRRTLQYRLSGIVGVFAIQLIGLAMLQLWGHQQAFGIDFLKVGFLYKDPRAIAPVYTLLSTILMVLILASTLAFLAYSKNRHTMRWYRSARSGESFFFGSSNTDEQAAAAQQTGRLHAQVEQPSR